MEKALELEVFNKLFSSVAEEMGIVLRRSSFSANIRERCDFSCAIFDISGELVAQASHIPVHLGAMPETLRCILPLFTWREGDIVITNDPYKGGTHLPDITLIKPLFFRDDLMFFLIVRAHHADVGGKYPGSMGLVDHIRDEGVLIEPQLIAEEGRLKEDSLNQLINKMRNIQERRGDFRAKFAALERGEIRLKELLAKYGANVIKEASNELKNYSERAFKVLLERFKRGRFAFVDYLDDDGFEERDIPIGVEMEITSEGVKVDFRNSAPQVRGPLNAPKAVTASAVYYVFTSLMQGLGDYPINHGLFRRIDLIVNPGTIVAAQYPAPVSGGNVETSQRIVDVLLGALHQAIPDLVPSASCGSMNNISFGNETWAYYETLGGGMGARPGKNGLSGVHTHMTNTLNTPIEVLEQLYPVRIERYGLRKGSGGDGCWSGGEGLVRAYRFLEPLTVSLLTERRRRAPYGLSGGKSGEKGKNYLVRRGEIIELEGKGSYQVDRGDLLVIETPGGGGFGEKMVEAASVDKAGLDKV